jgi:hypothetical protein
LPTPSSGDLRVREAAAAARADTLLKTIDEFAQAPPVKEFTLVNLYMDAFDEATV